MNKSDAPVPESQSKNKERTAKRNREDKQRKKDDKSVDHVLNVLSSLDTTEEKLGAMCQKYSEIFNDHRILQNAAKLAEKKNSILQKEKEQMQAEHSKAILSRSRLENLCRELQRQNKAVKEECMLKIREEEEKKREVAAKFQTTLTELGNLLAQNNDKNAKLREDNLDMTTKLKNVCEQYEKKEQHVEKMAKQMHLEMQLANTKLAKAKMEMALEKEGLLRDNQQLLLELKEYKKQLEDMKTSEIALRSQIQLYNDKYDEFHKALLQSNDAIGSFKQEMERMAKQIRKLEKETVAWKRRYETTHRTLLQMTEEKIKSDQTASVSERRLTALQGLCRTLQAQCNHLRGVVKAQSSDSANNEADEGLLTATSVVGLEITENTCETDTTPKTKSNEIKKEATSDLIDEVQTNVSEKNIEETTVKNSNTKLLEDIQNGTIEDDLVGIEEDVCLEAASNDREEYVENGITDDGEQNGGDICNHLDDTQIDKVPSAEESLGNSLCSNSVHNCDYVSLTASATDIQQVAEKMTGCAITTGDAVATVAEQTLEELESIQQQLPAALQQQQGRKNKGKRKKTATATKL